jgi:hypothetical protein
MAEAPRVVFVFSKIIASKFFLFILPAFYNTRAAPPLNLSNRCESFSRRLLKDICSGKGLEIWLEN